jgi:RimJ/RimL family protein N-acetyltransferase
MGLPPVIQLRALQVSDAATLAALANNVNIWSSLRDYFPHPYSEKDAVYFITSVTGQQPVLTFAVVFESQLAGVCSLIPQTDVYRHSAEIGYWLGQPFWNKGIATEAIRQLSHYGFETLGMARLYAGVFDFNQASARVLEKCGYVQEAVLKKAVIKNGVFCDELRYALVR